MLTLAAHGQCIIVGRGAAQALPPARTVRVRVVAPWDDRVSRLSHDQRISRVAARALLAERDQSQASFVREHFQKDIQDPLQYDLILNCDRISVAEGAQLIASTVALRQPGGAHREAPRAQVVPAIS
jgi:cytidylate kinase